MEKRKIEVSDKHKNILKDEFDCTIETVRRTLRYEFDSEKAKNIRKRAKELLQEEIEKLEI